MASLAMSRGTLQRVLGDVLRVMRLLYGKRLMAGSEAQLFWMMKRMLRSWSLSFPEVDFLASSSAKPTTLRRSLSTYAHFSQTSCQGISAPTVLWSVTLANQIILALILLLSESMLHVACREAAQAVWMKPR